MPKRQKMELYDFYCMNCGKKGLNLMRKSSRKHEKFHRKKLYCPYCKLEVNHIECKTFEEVEEFIKNFNDGVYKEEAKESIEYIDKEN